MTYPHITINPQGVPCIDETRHRVIDIVADHVAHGYSAAQIVKQYPDLTSAQVHAALTYYYDHQAEFDVALMASYTQAEHGCHHPYATSQTRGCAGAAGGLMLRLYMNVHVKAAITAGVQRRGINPTFNDHFSVKIPKLNFFDSLGRPG